MKTVLPAVSLSQLSGVSEMAVAAARVVAIIALLNMVLRDLMVLMCGGDNNSFRVFRNSNLQILTTGG